MTTNFWGTKQATWGRHLARTLEPPEPQSVLDDWPPTHQPDRSINQLCNAYTLSLLF